jgi:hypothetical protein
MFEKPCLQKLDEPVLVWMGLEFREVATSVGAGAGIAIGSGVLGGLGFLGIVAGLGVGLGLLLLFRSLRAGGPGYVFSRLYRAGVISWLPLGMRPRHLLPHQGRAARLRFSPVESDPDRSTLHERRKYFGR